MIPVPFKTLFTKCMITNQNLYLFRYVRSIARCGVDPKLIEGKVKTVTQYDDSEQIESFKDFVKSVRKSKLGDELEIEKNFLQEDYHGDVFERCEAYYDMHVSEEKRLKSHIKKKIIGQKYFKLDRETNLLTHAAKEQVRFLHKLNPLEWNCKALSECFPTSEAGVAKLLKSNFVQTCPEKIKAHDEDVARKWEILKSGKFTEEISPLTQKLYKEGKLVDDYFSGNPNLPTAPPPSKKVIEVKKKEEIGEFSAIVQTYLDYQEQKLLECKDSSEKQISLGDSNDVENHKKHDINVKNARKFKFAIEEFDDDNADPEVYPVHRKKCVNDGEIPFSQFKEILKEEAEAKLKSKYKNEYDDFVVQATSKTNTNTSKKPRDSQNCFIKISKYEKENVDLMYEKNEKISSIYKYDEKLGYQYPVGKSIKGKINFSSKQYKKGKLQKVGTHIYDENGKFLYKIPY